MQEVILKKVQKKYKWYDDFVHTYEKAYWYVQSYYFDRLEFDNKYLINEKDGSNDR